jgi:class 3 adenylate cyclase
MSFALYASKIQSEVLSERDALSKAYRAYPDANLYFCMIDLAQSSNYRITKGPELGYIRGESFFTLINASIRPYAEVRFFKEIGDAALICCSEIRPLLEAGMLMCQASRQLAFIGGDTSYPFAIRLGIDFGVVKKLTRRHEDYLGESIDRLARIMTVRSENTNFLIGEQAYELNRKLIEEYSSLYTASGPIQLALTGGKKLQEQVIYRELFPRSDPLPDFNDFFEPWRKQSVAGGSSGA